jgi:hypothetical protein
MPSQPTAEGTGRSFSLLQALGLTFGGIFAGHGVFAVEGPARFTLMSYQTV